MWDMESCNLVCVGSADVCTGNDNKGVTGQT